MSAKLETRFRENFLRKMKQRYGPDVYHQKHHGNEFSAGLPDSLVASKGRVVFVEFKAVERIPEKGIVFDFTQQPTKLQMYTLGQISKANGIGMSWVLIHVETGPCRVLSVPYELAMFARENKLYWPTWTLHHPYSKASHNEREAFEDSDILGRLFPVWSEADIRKEAMTMLAPHKDSPIIDHPNGKV